MSTSCSGELTIEVLQSKFMSKESNTVAYFHKMKPIATITHFFCSMDQVSDLGAYDSLVCFELKLCGILTINKVAVGGAKVWLHFQCRDILLIWVIVGQGPIALAVGTVGSFFLSSIFSLSLSVRRPYTD